MLRALHLKILSCLMIIIFPAAMFAADQASAMLYSAAPKKGADKANLNAPIDSAQPTVSDLQGAFTFKQ